MEDRDVEKLGNHLEGKKVLLMVTGGIAAYKSPSLIRHFRQYGADVSAYLTHEAEQFVGRKALEWATGKDEESVLTENTCDSKHLKHFDAYVVAPLTYNTVGKFANGIADNLVTTTFASALGNLENGNSSILIVPTMHDTMQNQIYKNNLEKITSHGVKMISPEYKWGKANYPGSHTVVVETIRALSKSKLKGKKMLITGGPTPVWIDNVRYITNRFRGRSGIAIAEEAYMRGADVKYIHGSSGIQVPKFLDCKVVRSYEEYFDSVMQFAPGKEIGIFSAAVADYMPTEKKEGKLPSKGALNTLTMKNTVKVIDAVKEKFPDLVMVSFKYEEMLSEEKLIDIAISRITRGHRIVVANRGEEMEKTKHNSIIVTGDEAPIKTGSKQETASKLLDIIEKSLT